MNNFTTEENIQLLETKLVDIVQDFELNSNNTLMVEEERKDGSLVLVNIRHKETLIHTSNTQKELPNWNVAPFDLGGHSPYFSSQKMFSSKSSFFFLIFSR